MHLPSRRQLLQQAACGFGSLALSGLAQAQRAGSVSYGMKTVAYASGSLGHLPARAKRVIFLFMQGGVSQVDSFDYKPALEKRDGQTLAFDDARVIANTGMRGSSQRVMK